MVGSDDGPSIANSREIVLYVSLCSLEEYVFSWVGLPTYMRSSGHEQAAPSRDAQKYCLWNTSCLVSRFAAVHDNSWRGWLSQRHAVRTPSSVHCGYFDNLKLKWHGSIPFLWYSQTPILPNTVRIHGAACPGPVVFRWFNSRNTRDWSATSAASAMLDLEDSQRSLVPQKR